MRHVHKSLNIVIETEKADITVHICDQTELEKKRTRKNTIESSNGSQLKLWQIFA